MSAGELATAAAQRLALEFAPRDSEYFGQYFKAVGARNEEFLVLTNFRDRDGELLELNHPEEMVFLRVDQTERADELALALSDLPGLLLLTLTERRSLQRPD